MSNNQFSEREWVQAECHLTSNTISRYGSCLLRLKIFAAIALGIACCSQPLAADLIFHDTFDIGSPPTRFDDADDPNDLNWYRNNRINLGIGDDSAGIGSGNALDVSPNAADPTFGAFAASFDTVPLNTIGDTATLSFDFRRTGMVTGTSASFRFGLFNDGGTPITTDNGSNFLAFAGDDSGYTFILGVEQSGATAYREAADGATILAGGLYELGTDTVNPFSGFNDLAPYEIALLLERVDDGINLQVLVNGITHINVTDIGIDPVTLLPDGLFITDFNSVGFGIGSTGASYGYRLDNIRFEFNAVPEPSSLLLVGSVAGALSIRRRRST